MMSVAEYAAYERAMGAAIEEASDVFWRRVRPLFYRPLLVFTPVDPASVRPPRAARWGGWQCAVADPARANSVIPVLLFRDAQSYTLDTLEKKRRWEVRTATRQFQVRPILDRRELAEQGHGVFVEFQRRTGYKYRADRVRASTFAAWAHEVFQHPKVQVLGAFAAGQLCAVALVQAVRRTLLYSTFFAREEALKRHVASLILHEVRALAARTSGIEQMYAGVRKVGPEASVDQFYIQRGCDVVLLPARYWLNPLVAKLLRMSRPEQLKRLTGAGYMHASMRENCILDNQ